MNMKCHRAQSFLQHRSHTEPGWEACGQQRAETTAAGPYSLAFPLTDVTQI